MSSCVPCFGLNNLYNAARFVVAYQTDPAGAELQRFLRVYTLQQASYLVNPARRLVQEYLFGGWYRVTSVDHFIKGLETWEYADRVHAGNFSYGDAYSVSQYITPVLNTVKGTMVNQTLGIFSGGENLDRISSIGLMNG